MTLILPLFLSHITCYTIVERHMWLIRRILENENITLKFEMFHVMEMENRIKLKHVLYINSTRMNCFKMNTC